MDVTLRIVGQADPGQIDAMRKRIEELGPALKKALDSSTFGVAASAAKAFADAQLLQARAGLEQAKVATLAARANVELAGAQKQAAREAAELAGAQKIAAREAAAASAEARRLGQTANDTGRSGGASIGGLLDKIKSIHPATAAAVIGLGAVALGVSQLAGAVQGFLSEGVSLNAQFETFETQLGTLMGSTDAAKERIGELSAFAASTPFELPQLIGLEKLLVGFGLTGENVMRKFGMDTAALRTSIGDMAAGTGVDIVELGNTWGKFASGASGEAISRLQELGIVTREQLQGVGIDFSKSGQLVSPLPEALQAAIGLANEKFGGGMAALSNTFEGQMSTMSDNWNGIKRVVSEPIFDVLKEGLGGVNAILSSPALTDGLTVLASLVGDVLRGALDALRGAVQPFVTAWQAFTEGFSLEPDMSFIDKLSNGFGNMEAALGPDSAIPGVLNSIMSAARTAATGLMLLWDAGKAVGAWLIEHAPSWDTLKVALMVVGGAIVGLGAVLLSTLGPALVAAATAAVAFIAPMVAAAAPAIALGAVIGLVAGLIITHWDEIKAATSELFASLSQTWQEIQDAISQAVTALWAFVQSAWASGVAWVTAATAAFQAWLSQAWETIKTNVSAAASALWGWLRGAFSAGVSFLVGVKTRLAQGFVAVWNWITTTVSSIVARLINWIRTAWQNGMEWVAGLLGRVSSVFSGAWTWIANTVGGLVSRMVNALSAALLAGGKFVASVQDRISDVFQRGWTFVVGIFKSAAGSIIGGIKSLFGGIARIVLDGMTAAGSIVDSILKKIIGRISSFVSSLGLGSVMSGVIGNLKSAAGSILGGLADGFGSIISGIGSGIGNVTSFFSDKIATARGKVSDLFSGFQALKLQSAKEGGAGGGPDTGLGGGGADISALGATAASGPKDIMNVGDAGRDSQGDYYIDENGAKVYTSGAGLAKQQAKERAREAREAERAARADKSASRASARREASEGSVAREMADTAKKVAEAVQAGLDAIEGLRGSEIPGEAIWRPRLDALSAFVAAAAEKFQAIGKGLLTQIGVTDEGTAKLDDAAAQQAQAASDLGGSMMDTVTKTATFLQGLVKAKWPTPEQVDLALSQISGVLTRVQAQAQDMASKIAMKTEDTDPAAHLGAVGQAVGSWVDAYLKIGAEAEKLAKMPPVPEGALASVENIMRRVSGMMGSLLVGPGYDLLEDTEASKDHLSVADAMAGTIQAGLDVVMRAAETARELQRVPPVDEGALDAVQTIMQRVSAMIGALVVGPGYDLLADNERSTRDLATAREMVATIAAGTDLVDKIAAGARTLARVRDVPDTALDAIQAVMRRVSDMIGALVVGPGYNLFADNEKSLADLSVARAMVDTIGAGVALVEQTGRLGDVLARAKPIPQAAVEAIYATWRRVSDILGGLLIGPGYNLLADPERTIRDLSVARALVDLLSVAVGMVTQTAVMGDALARANPIPPGAVDVAVQTAVQVERLVREAASAWRAAIEAAGGWIEDTMAMTRNYADHLKSVLGVATEAAKLKLDKVLPLDPAALEVALANAALVERRVRAYADQWATIMETAGLWTDEVAAGVKLYTEHAKNTIGLVQAAAGLSLKDILPLDPAMLDVALENARLAERRVRAFADAWASALEAADLVLADVAARVKTYADHIKEVVGIVDAAGGLGIEDVVPIDEFQVTLALSNVRLAEGWVRRWAGEWHRMMTAAGVEIEAVLAETKTYSEQVKAVVDTIMAGAELVLTDVKALSVADIERVLANVTLVLDRVSAYAGEWADAIRAGGRKLEDVVADAEGYHTVVGGAVEMIVKASDAFRHLVANPPPRIMPGVMALLREQITMMILDLAGIYDVVEDEKGRLKKAGDVAAIVAPAADAVAKALDALSIERLLKNPLTDTKLRSGFMQRVADRRFEALAKQISAGVRRAVQALVDGLTGITIPEGIATALDPLVAVYERVVALIERINALAVPDAAKLAQIIGLAQGLGALGGTGAPPPASGHGFTGGAQGKGTPLVPPPGGGGAGGAGGGGARMDATINVTSPVYLDTDQIGAAIERTLMARNLAIVVTPQGG